MKRAILVMLILLLPLQLSWAAMAPYCQDESDQTRMHFGHHEHTSNHKPVLEKEKTSTSMVDTGAECGWCHLSCCKSAASSAPTRTSADAELTLYLVIPSHFSSHIAEGPEKPNWYFAA